MPDHEQPILVDKSSNDQIVEVTIGQTIEVRLEENPTTGFRWYLTSEGAPACASIDDTFTAAPAGPPGKGGSHTWRFEALHAGECAIEFHYRRRWEKSADGNDVFTVHVKVRS